MNTFCPSIANLKCAPRDRQMYPKGYMYFRLGTPVLECERYVVLCNAYASCANKVKGFVKKHGYQNYLLNNIAVEEMMKQMSQVYFPQRIKTQSTSFPFRALEHFLQNLHHSSLNLHSLHCRQFSYVLGNAFKKQTCQTSC